MNSSEERCKMYKTIPQFSHTCWFNSILHVMIYSSGLRKTIYNYLKGIAGITSDQAMSDDTFLRFLYYMLHNYKKLDNIHRIYNKLQSGIFNTDYILISFLRKYHKSEYDRIKKKLRNKYNDSENSYFYIYYIFASYKINYVDLLYNKTTGNLYFQLVDSSLSIAKHTDSIEHFINKIQNSDILCIAHNTNNDLITSALSTRAAQNHNLDRYKEHIRDYSSLIKDIREFSKKITINDNEYILDSCIIVNINNQSHAISCITCGEKGYYVYDSWDNFKSIKSNEYKKRVVRNSCPTYKYDWTNTAQDFAISDVGCDFQVTSRGTQMPPGYMNYNIETSQVLLIYIKSSKYFEYGMDTIDSPPLDSFQINKSAYLRELREIYDLESLSTQELATHIINIYDDAYDTKGQLLIHLSSMSMAGHLRFLYEKILKKSMNPDPNPIVNENMCRELYIALILKFINKGTVLKYDNLITSSFFANMKNLFLRNNFGKSDKEKLDYAFNSIGLNNPEDKEYRENLLKYINDIYELLFIADSKWYNEFIKQTVMEISEYKDETNIKFYCIILRYKIDIDIYKLKKTDILFQIDMVSL